MKNTIVAVVMAIASPLVASADMSSTSQICDTIESCRALQAKIEGRLVELAVNTISATLGDFARNEDGSVRLMDLFGAMAYCDKQGERLPTARELALYSQSLGAQGISNVGGSGEKPGHDFVLLSEPGTCPSENFYFNSLGYRRPEGDFGKYHFWSSSFNYMWRNAYVLDGASGGIRGVDSGTKKVAVRCVRPID